MKWSSATMAMTALGQCIGAVAVAVPSTNDIALSQPSHEERSYDEHSTFENLFKRKGGGSSGGRGGSSGSGGSSSSGSSGSSSGSSSSGSSNGKGGSSSSSSGSSGSGATSGGRGSSSSSTGGSTTTGSGPRPAYGAGGTYYGGGSTSPYTSGLRSPGGIVPGLLIGSSLGFLGTYWLLGAYSYPYTHPYYYHNATTNKNETKPVNCLCRTDQECSCDDNGDQTYFNSIIGNGTYQGLNQSVVTVADANGTSTIFINGTLPNGTTASGGTEDPNAAGSMQSLLHTAGWLPVATTLLVLAYLS